jgi:hypothetical protein
VPADIIEQLRPRMPETVLSQLERHFTAQLLRSEQACPSVTLERALWSLAIQPRRSGHRRIRPWTVSIDLLAERARQMDPGTVRAPLLVHMKQCSRYLASCVG